METEEQQPKLTAKNFPTEIDIKFITNTYHEKVTETPFKLPSDLSRHGLSEIINHLLGHQEPTPFEFLIHGNENNVLLRTTLKEFFLKIQEYPETTITLEYMEAQPAPKSVDSIPHDDWVSAVSCIDENILLTGCYDGIVRVLNTSGSTISEAKHNTPIIDLATFQQKNDSISFVTATREQNGYIWNYKNKKCEMVGVLKGHSSNVEAVDFNPTGNLICSGAQDKLIKLWETSGKKVDKEEPKAKKAKTHDASKLEIEALGTLEGHKSGITSIIWKKTENILISGSFDHTIRLWDVSRATPIATLSGNKVVTSVSLNEELGLIVSGHPDHMVRTWDPRQKVIQPTILKSHKSWIRQVKWMNSTKENHSNYQFFSCADDNSCKVWDIRSTIPLHTIVHNIPEKEDHSKYKKWKAPQKVLCGDWSLKGQKKIYTGSSDCTLKRHVYE